MLKIPLIQLFSLVLFVSACKKDNSKTNDEFVDNIDSLNYIEVDSVKYFHMNTRDASIIYNYHDYVGQHTWWNSGKYPYCKVYLFYSPGPHKIQFTLVDKNNDTIQGNFEGMNGSAIEYGSFHGRGSFMYDSLKVYSDPKDSSKYFYISGHSTY